MYQAVRKQTVESLRGEEEPAMPAELPSGIPLNARWEYYYLHPAPSGTNRTRRLQSPASLANADDASFLDETFFAHYSRFSAWGRLFVA